jgi:hypothetical protein
MGLPNRTTRDYLSARSPPRTRHRALRSRRHCTRSDATQQTSPRPAAEDAFTPPSWLLELRRSGAFTPQVRTSSGPSDAISTECVAQQCDDDLLSPGDVGDGSHAHCARHFYDRTDWEAHVDVSRYWRHLEAMPKSRTVRAVLVPTLFSLAQVMLFAAYDALHPAGWPGLPVIGMDLFSLTGPVLSLLLVFRTDSSYTRWDEARQQIGCVNLPPQESAPQLTPAGAFSPQVIHLQLTQSAEARLPGI